jgi:hypothetical protein
MSMPSGVGADATPERVAGQGHMGIRASEIQSDRFHHC